jgi:hypothetical protein
VAVMGADPAVGDAHSNRWRHAFCGTGMPVSQGLLQAPRVGAVRRAHPSPCHAKPPLQNHCEAAIAVYIAVCHELTRAALRLLAA